MSRPHIHRFGGKFIIHDGDEGYVRPLTKLELFALAEDAIRLLRNDAICEGAIPKSESLPYLVASIEALPDIG